MSIEQRLKALQKQLSPTYLILNTLLLLFAGAIIICYLSGLLGVDYFILPMDATGDNALLNGIVSCALYMLNMFFVFSFTLGFKLKRTLIITAIYAPIMIIEQFASIAIPELTVLFTGVSPILYCIIVAIYYKYSAKSIGKTILKGIIISVISCIYQWLTMPIKFGLVPIFQHVNTSLIAKVIYQVDFLLMLFFITIKGGGWNNAVLELLVCPENIQYAEIDDEDKEQIDLIKSKPMREQLIIGVKLIAFQIFQLFLILGVCLIGNIWIESVVILISYGVFGFIIKRRWHHKSVVVCTLASVGMFYLAARSIPPLYISQLLPILAGLGIMLALYLAVRKPDVAFQANFATESELRAKCRSLGFGAENTDYAVELFVKKTPQKILASARCVEVETIKQEKYRLKKLLEKQ